MPFETRRKTEAEAAARGEPIASGAVACVPYGVPRMMSVALYPIEILPTPGQITIVAEAFSEVRRIYMNKPQLPMDDVPPGYYGRLRRTLGRRHARRRHRRHQDRQCLRIRTCRTAIACASPSGCGLSAHDILHDQITIDDPVVLEKPVTYTLAYRRMPGYEMVEFVCDNNREYIDEKGGTHLRVRDR